MSAVLISGATGFIAQHIISDLLGKGYEVIGTVRSEQKAARLQNLFQSTNLRLEVVADLSSSGAFDEVFIKHKGRIKYVIHAASPCHYNSVDYEKDMLLPAVNGTKSILESIKKYAPNSVEHVVLTSSFAAVSNVKDAYNNSLTFDEESWNRDSWNDSLANAKTAYYGSKAFAEKAAWNFLKENEKDINFTLTAINPCYVFGPQCFDESASSKLNASCQLINDIVFSKKGDDFDQDFASLFIDVRDVSKAHVHALENPSLAGKRLLLANTKFSTQDIIDVLSTNFPQFKGRIVEGTPGNGPNVVKNIATLDNTKSKILLGFEFKSFEEAVGDTVAQILRAQAYPSA